MGFFFAEQPVEAAQAKKPTSKAAKREIRAGERGCDACSLKAKWGTIASPRMPMAGPPDADILILGPGPNGDADRIGEPFKGAADKLLLDVLPSRHRERIAFQNITRCHSANVPSYQDMHACSIHLDADCSGIKYILGVGQAPLSKYWPGATITRVHGVPMPITLAGHDCWYFPILDPQIVMDKGGMKTAAGTILRADIKRFFDEHKSWGKPRVATNLDPKAVIVPTSYEQAREIVDAMQDQPLGIDLETADDNGATLKPYTKGARIISGSISDGDTTIAFAVDHPEQRNYWGLRLLLEIAYERPWVAHNSGFEWAWLRFFHLASGGNPELYFKPFDDSQALARIMFDRETVASLDDCSIATLGADIKAITGINAKRILDYPLAEILPYNGIDAQASALIWRRGHSRVNPSVYRRLLQSIETLAELELLGLPIDLAASDALNKEWSDKIVSLEAQAKRIYEVKQFEMANQKTFRLSANEDIGEALAVYGKLKLPSKTDARGKTTYGTDEAVLLGLTKDQKHPLVTCVLDYREAAGTKSKYIDVIQEVPEKFSDRLLHPSYTVLLTRTGRTSSNDPNIQNFPKRQHREIRRQIIPPPGHMLVPIDFGQIEARVIAMASMDKVLCDAIISGYDIHSVWRDKILAAHPPYYERMAEMGNVDPDDKKATLKAGRNIIKTDFVFASFFGGMPNAVAARTGIPLRIAEQVSEEFWDTFRGVKNWIKKQRAEYAETGAIRTLTDRVRRGIEYGNEPINTPIQGTAADIMLDGMNDLRALTRELKDPAFMPRIEIHDDLTFFLPDSEDLEVYIEEIAKVMVQVRYDWQVVPLMAEASIGYNWADIEEFNTYIGDYRR